MWAILSSFLNHVNFPNKQDDEEATNKSEKPKLAHRKKKEQNRKRRKKDTCAFCEGVTRQQIAVLESTASSVKASLNCFKMTSRAQPSTTNAKSYCIWQMGLAAIQKNVLPKTQTSTHHVKFRLACLKITLE